MSIPKGKGCKTSLVNVEKKFNYIFVFGKKYSRFVGVENCSELEQFITNAKENGKQNCICENTQRCGKLNLYFDLDEKKRKMSDDEISKVITDLKEAINDKFPNTTNKIFVKDASSNQMTSLHLIVHLETYEGTPIYIKDKEEMKELCTFIGMDKVFDTNAYSGYNVRILYSNKYDQKNDKWENRRFKISDLSEIQDEKYSLCTYCPEEEYITLNDYVKKQFICDYVYDQGFTKDYDYNQINKRDQEDHWSLILKEQKCTKRKHKSNNSVAMLFQDNITIKCQDTECQSVKYQKIKIGRFKVQTIDNQSQPERQEQQSRIQNESDTEGQNIRRTRIVDIGDVIDELNFKTETHKQYFQNIMNEDFQYIPELYNLDYPNEFIYIYDEKNNGYPMYFDNSGKTRKHKTNGGFWNSQGAMQIARKRVRDYTVKYLRDISKQLDNQYKYQQLIQKKIKNIRNSIKITNELDQYLMETYFNGTVIFNDNPNYLHFQNGTFDLEQRKLIKTTPEMYNTFQINYSYDESVSFDKIYEQLSQIMEKDQFEWFLKQLSNCLNPLKVIQEKQIIILTGFGNNGKTVLFKLMNNTFDLKAYALSSRHQMIQGPTGQANSATPDTAKLIYKRFCCIPELEKNLAFNQQQVKILTGGEEIQSRDLYQSLVTFQPVAGIFISCNQVPYIDTTDGGFLNRLRIIDLKYQFIEKPNHRFQKQINYDLQYLITTTEWKQGFMNLLIDYYYRPKVQLPESIQRSIQLREDLQKNPINLWAEDHLVYQQDTYIFAEDVRKAYEEETGNNVKKQSFNKQLNNYIQQNPHIFLDVGFKKRTNSQENISGQAFINCALK